MQYDLLVIGSGPAGQEGALAAAKLHKRVALVEHKRRTVGGMSVPSDTIFSHALRNAIRLWSRDQQSPPVTTHQSPPVAAGGTRPSFGRCPSPPVGFARPITPHPSPQITLNDLRSTLQQRMQHEWDAVHNRLDRNGVDLFDGEARFIGPHEVEVTQSDDNAVLQADFILIACGAKPSRPRHIPFDGERILNADDVWNLQTLPRSMVVVGGGVVGVEFALLFAGFGVRVTVVERREHLLDGCDTELVDAVTEHADSLGIVLGEEVMGVDRRPDGRLAVRLESGRRLMSESVLYTAGRVGHTQHLNLSAVGIEPDECSRLWCNEDLQTWVPHIYGAGDVVGYPSWARHATGQGRRVVEHAFGSERPLRRVHEVPDRSTAQHADLRLQPI